MKNGKLKTILIIILSVAIVLTLGFIWGNSMETIEQSAETSSNAYETTTDIIISVGGEPAGEKFQEAISPELFRKFAHAIEFALLGFETVLLFLVIFGFRYKNFLYTSSGCLLVALLDETIQIFSGRGAAIEDVWIDFLGVCIPTLFILVVGSIVTGVKKHKAKKTKEKPIEEV